MRKIITVRISSLQFAPRGWCMYKITILFVPEIPRLRQSKADIGLKALFENPCYDIRLSVEAARLF